MTGSDDQYGISNRTARDLQQPVDEDRRMQIGVSLAVALIDGCDHAGISRVEGHRIVSGSTSDATAAQADAWQYELGDGPCLEAIHDRTTILSRNLSSDQRWPVWAARASTILAVASSLSLLLFTYDRSYGALNLYADAVDAFDASDVAAAESLAAHLAVAMASGQEIAQRGNAMAGRTVIGQAEGILMERLGLDADHAFDFLRRISQDGNRKLVEVATEIVSTRRLPMVEPSGSSHSFG